MSYSTSESHTSNDPENASSVPLSPDQQPSFSIHRSSVNVYSNSVVNEQTNVSKCAPHDTAFPYPVNHVKQPIQHFTKTRKYLAILEDAQKQNVYVLHCHGFPGTGKSEIVRKLAESFPYDDRPILNTYVKWHVECGDKGHDIKLKMKELVKALREQAILKNTNNYQDILNSIDNDTAVPFIETLVNTGVPILIIIEDVTRRSAFLEDLLRSVERQNKNQHQNAQLHIYLTTTNKTIVISQDEHSQMTCFKMQEIKGFDEDEGIGFLLNKNSLDNEPKEDFARRVVNRFSGSPLGLHVAKAYCKKFMIDYKYYLEDNEVDILVEEDEIAECVYGQGAKHIFQAITKQFELTEQSGKKEHLIWKVLSSMSYFHRNKIPRFVIERCFQLFREKTPRNMKRQNKKDSGSLISNLLNSAMCTLSEDGDITFHEVILRAFRVCHTKHSPSKFDSIKNAVWVMASLVTKDLRSRETSAKVYKLTHHLNALLHHIAENRHTIEEKEDKKLFFLVLSHLYEAAGAITIKQASSYRHLSDKYFKCAIDKLWTDSRYDLTDPAKHNSDTEKVSTDIFKTCTEKQQDFPIDLITKYRSIVFNATFEPQLKFLESKSTNKEKFETAREAITALEKNQKIIYLLQEAGVFLEMKRYKKIFLIERLATIFQSWSHVILHDGSTLPKQNYEWFSSLSYDLSRKCREKFGIRLLSEHLSYISGKVPITAKLSSDAGVLNQAREFCEEHLRSRHVSVDYYEHGLLKEVPAPSDAQYRIVLLRRLIRVYAKLFKSECSEELLGKGNTFCSELLQLATDHVSQLSAAPQCIIRCAKYYAATGNFEKAFLCFEIYFENTTPEQLPFQLHSWAVWNFARAVLHFKSLEHQVKAVEMAEEVLKTTEVIDVDMRSKLQDTLSDLNDSRFRGFS